jgi:serine/threonine protein kinase
MVMEYIPGLTFAAYLERQGGRIPYAAALAILMPVMDVLRAIHQVDDLLHRDIAPDNMSCCAARRLHSRKSERMSVSSAPS